MVSEVADTYGRIDILVNNAGGTVPTPNVEDVPELVQRIQGAPRADDDFERTALFHSFADSDEPDQPAVVRHPRLPPDARPGRCRVDHQHLQRYRSPGRLANARFLRCGEGRAQPPHPIAGRGVGAACPRQRPGARTDDDRQLPFVRAAQGRSGGSSRTSATFRWAARASPPRSAGPVCSCAAVRPTSSTAPPSRSTVACCPACCTTRA